MAIRILTDSTSDILPEEARARDLDLVPLRVAFGEELYRDGVDLSHQDFYQKLAQADTLPTTSQPTPDDFLPYFEAARDRGDQLICILLSGGLSGTVQSATIARDLAGYEDIFVVDSHQAVTGLRVLVDLACVLREEGKSAAQIVAELESARDRVRLFAMVDTLEYLHKGGRLSAASAVAGTLLKVKPFISLNNTLSVVGKAMGLKAALKQLLGYLGDDLKADPRLPLYLGYTCIEGNCLQFQTLVAQQYPHLPTQVHSVGAVIGAHFGPGATVFSYLEQE